MAKGLLQMLPRLIGPADSCAQSGTGGWKPWCPITSTVHDQIIDQIMVANFCADNRKSGDNYCPTGQSRRMVPEDGEERFNLHIILPDEIQVFRAGDKVALKQEPTGNHLPKRRQSKATHILIQPCRAEQ